MASRTLSAMGVGPSAKFLQPSRFPKERQQVAAVCYRIRKRGIEFLLVQTRGGRWIFPKGGVEPCLTHAQSAALEAFEEAGVHGRMEAIPFARYFRRKRDTAGIAKGKRSAAARFSPPELAVAATFAKCLGWNRRRNRIETPPGFPPKKRSNASFKAARRNLAPNWLASSIAPWHASGDCMETPVTCWVIRSWVTPSWATPSQVTPG